jgi:hypothetical protein
MVADEGGDRRWGDGDPNDGTGQATKFRSSRLVRVHRPSSGVSALKLTESGSCPQRQGANGKTLFERPRLARQCRPIPRSPLDVPETSHEAREKHVSGI